MIWSWTKSLLVIAAGFCICLASASVVSARGEKNQGEELFKQNCAMCHPDGGNVVNPKKTLHKKDREANNVRSAKDIVKLMRKPGPGMLTFDEQKIPNDKANEIASYILKTFK